MGKIEVKICMGTTCFVMGAANLQELLEIIPKKYPNTVNVSGVPCLDLCAAQSKYTNAPYVTIDDVLISDATTEKVLKEIEKRLDKNGQK